MAKQVLGKGLGALIGSGGITGVGRPPALSQPAPGDSVRRVGIDEVIPSPLQPRKRFEPTQLSELLDSIREHGIIQPLIVRQVQGKLELIAGERRWRASKELGLKEVPVIVREASDRDVLEMALIENIQRENLNPIEEAQAYARLSKDFHMRQEDIAQRVGKNRATVANTMRLLDLPDTVQDLLGDGQISTGHAKVLLSLRGAKDQEAAADEITRKGLTVRATEKLIATILNPPKKVEAPKLGSDVAQAVKAVEERLTRHFATNTAIAHAEKKGRIEIDYYGADDLNRILSLMGVEEEDFG
jgi:ParB family transcriptional regulator, chromosome partitioning protein